MGEQQLDDLLEALVGGAHEAGVTVNIRGVHVDIFPLQQLLHDVDVAFIGRTHQGGVSVIIGFVDLDPGIF